MGDPNFIFNVLRRVQVELRTWQEHNFPGRDAWEPLVGMQEELGELSHAFLKRHQGIRTGEDHESAILDALSDLLIYACDFANAEEINLASALEETWEEVRKRDWVADPEGAGGESVQTRAAGGDA